jgi:hypothetical protein
LFGKLAEMHERLTQTPGYIAPTAEEEEQAMVELEARFRELGHDIAGWNQVSIMPLMAGAGRSAVSSPARSHQAGRAIAV